tara:strand:+ start:5646 stop:6800 length:1155 start_codon:yes stop_codon:yes gene_type:complete
MAESTRSLDYGLSGDILDRVAGAREAKYEPGKRTIYDTAVDLGTKALEKGKEKQAAQQESLADWDSAFDAMGDRGSWASPQLFDQFQELERGYRDAYIEAVRSGNKADQQRMLKEQAARSSSLQGWKDVMETAKQINDEVGWGALVTRNSKSKAILQALAKGDGSAVPVVGENGELLFQINGERYSRSQIDDLVAKGTNPKALRSQFLNGAASQMEAGLKNGVFEYSLVNETNLNSLDNDKMYTYIYDAWTGPKSFAEEIKAIEGATFSIQVPENHPLDTTGDGTVDIQDFQVKGIDIDTMLEAMQDPENIDIAKQVIADYMTIKQKINYEKGKKIYDERQQGRFANMTDKQQIDAMVEAGGITKDALLAMYPDSESYINSLNL